MEAKNRWEKGFFGSFLFHLIIFFLVAFVAAAGASNVLPQDEFIEVDYFAGTGGGGGGGGGGEKPITHSILEDRPASGSDQNTPDTRADMKVQSHDPEQIVDKNKAADDSSKNTASKDNNESKPIYPGSDQLPNTGSGGGYGTGTGTGIGSGTGSGSGSGTGGGHGSGTGTGIGSGSGAGTGGNASQTVAVRPRVISNPKPVYPEQAKREGWSGTASVRIQIDENGSVVGASVTASSGHAILDEAALTAVRKWRFQPAKNGQGVAIKCAINMPVVFSFI